MASSGIVCAICRNPIDVRDYSGQELSSHHEVNLTVIAMSGDTSLPYVLEVHGECLRDLRDQIVEKNKGCTWV